MKRLRWLEGRRKGVGGSDVAPILGVSKWRSAWDVWADKTGRIPLDDSEETKPQKRGRLLEDAVARWYAEDSGFLVRLSAVETLTGAEPWQLASPDRMAQDGAHTFGLECKTARDDDGWGESGAVVGARDAGTVMPIAYALQCCWYMEICNTDRWDVAVLVMTTDDFRRYTITRDEEFGAALLAKVGAWWTEHVCARVEPPIEGTPTAEAWLLSKYPTDRGELREATDEEAGLIRELNDASEAGDAAEKRLKDAKARIKQAIGDDRGLTHEDCGRVTWTTQAGSSRLDSKRLRAEKPEIADQYTRQGTPIRVLRRKSK